MGGGCCADGAPTMGGGAGGMGDIGAELYAAGMAAAAAAGAGG
ncbi:hypothetical protein [Polyangium mundeleinium]|uniref:PE family protein n=1 Tax=Polyangium mundeleinium TaxID=2995306 RepID=A0ABT5F7Q6_9BACT|nr:hypothetical protein [Polyangium mundeleinium]MDC0749126.1 hypothetical protein [Polyangium mundeleinium]